MTQLERLARPFPSQYVKKPAQGKYGAYVPHDVVTQALLAIVGPYDLHVGEVFYGTDHQVEGCLVTLACSIDGRSVIVTEVGDCEQPGNWKTQGARMKDAISDGVKRCAMRLGLGLHLWAQEDYFLYDQLKNAAVSSDGEARQESRPISGSAEENRPEPSVSAAPAQSPATPTSPSANRKAKVKARAMAIGNWNLVNERSKEWNLPSIERSNDKQLDLYEEMLDTLDPVPMS